jgi:hypothetical protein
MIIKTRREIAEYIEAAFKSEPDLKEMAEAVREDDGNDNELEQIKEELLSLIQADREHPEYGEEWGPWLDEHIVELAQEAASIVA